MENTGVRQRIVATAPYADTPITLSLQSLSTERYKTYYCFECGHPFLQRDNDTLYRINSNSEPGRIYSDESGILTRCGRCKQKYSGSVATSPPKRPRDEFPEVRLQSIYIIPTAGKQQRYTHCMECNHTFCSISDRIYMVVDNVVPLQFIPDARIGLLEVRCKTARCGQRWALLV